MGNWGNTVGGVLGTLLAINMALWGTEKISENLEVKDKEKSRVWSELP